MLVYMFKLELIYVLGGDFGFGKARVKGETVLRLWWLRLTVVGFSVSVSGAM